MILTYHSLDDSGSVLSTSPALFREQMRALADAGVPVVKLSELRTRPGALAITFDDGYANILDHVGAGPPATVFVVSRCGETKTAWPGAAPFPLMSWAQINALRLAGVEVGAHTATHPVLTQLSEAMAAGELDECRAEIEKHTGVPPTVFAYPYGVSSPAVRRLVSERFGLACGTRLGVVEPDADPFDLPRIDTYYFRDLRRFRALIAGRARGYLALRALLRAMRARLVQSYY